MLGTGHSRRQPQLQTTRMPHSCPFFALWAFLGNWPHYKRTVLYYTCNVINTVRDIWNFAVLPTPSILCKARKYKMNYLDNSHLVGASCLRLWIHSTRLPNFESVFIIVAYLKTSLTMINSTELLLIIHCWLLDQGF